MSEHLAIAVIAALGTIISAAIGAYATIRARRVNGRVDDLLEELREHERHDADVP